MELTFATPECAVFDDVLPKEQLHALFDSFRATDFKFVHETRHNLPRQMQSGYKRAWRLDEGNALTAKGYVAFAMEADRVPSHIAAIAKTWADERETTFFPSGHAVDAFIGPLKQLALERLSPWIGTPETEWIAFTATPYIHPPGVGMSWHADEVLYTGAFSFFCHPEWDAEFGGEFLVYDDAIKTRMGESWRNRAFDPLAMPATNVPGYTGGRFIEPVPNRLIVIKRGVMHKVQRVSPLAGSHVRASITGFFLDTNVAARVMG
jgi:hypothetical protein